MARVPVADAVIDLFAGPGGWDVAARQLGLDPVGVEYDDAACATRVAAGLRTLQADVAALDPHAVMREAFGTPVAQRRDSGPDAERMPRPVSAPSYTVRASGSGSAPSGVEWIVDTPPLRGLIGSPPCPTFSSAGNGAGRHLTDILIACADALAHGDDTRERAREEAYAVLLPVVRAAEQAKARKASRAADYAKAEERARRDAAMSVLVVEPLRWALALRPEWVALEQVPPVLPLWEAFARILVAAGYGTWTGVLEAERYGVPQTRERAFLLARRDGHVGPPAPTHQRYVPGEPQRHDVTLEGEILPWVSMAEALGWGMTARPSLSVASGGEERRGAKPLGGGSGSQRTIDRERDRGDWVVNTRGGRQTPGGNEFDPDGPARTGTQRARSWQLRANSRPHAAVRDAEEPAPTIKGGHDTAERVWMEKRDDTPARKAAGAGNQPRPVSAPAATIDTGIRQAEWVADGPPTHLDRRQGGAPPGAAGEPAHTQSAQGLAKGRDVWVHERPATTVRSNGNEVTAPTYTDRNPDWKPGDPEPSQATNAVRVSEQEAAVLQGFPPDYPWQGSRSKRFQQIGNAVPPPLALAVLRAVTNRT